MSNQVKGDLSVEELILNDGRNYSTSETNTGQKWINGKAVYRRVFTGAGPASLGNLGGAEGVYYDEIIDIAGSMRNTGALGELHFGDGWGNDSVNGFYISVGANGDVLANVSGAFSNASTRAIITYTKV